MGAGPLGVGTGYYTFPGTGLGGDGYAAFSCSGYSGWLGAGGIGQASIP